MRGRTVASQVTPNVSQRSTLVALPILPDKTIGCHWDQEHLRERIRQHHARRHVVHPDWGHTSHRKVVCSDALSCVSVSFVLLRVHAVFHSCAHAQQQEEISSLEENSFQCLADLLPVASTAYKALGSTQWGGSDMAAC